MSQHHDAHAIPTAPPPIKLALSVRAAALVAVLIGAGAFFFALNGDHHGQAWSAFLIGAFYALSLGLFGVLWIAMLYLGKGVWSVSMPSAVSSWWPGPSRGPTRVWS